MKATIFLSALILFAALMGCSDNPTFFETQDQQFNGSVSQQKDPGGSDNAPELVWTKKELRVTAGSEAMAENKCVYSSLPFTDIASYKIEFDVFTNADRFSNGYIPIVEVSKDEEVVYTSSAFPNENGDMVTHVGMRLSQTRFNEIKFAVTLMQGDNIQSGQDQDVPTTLTLSNLAIYRSY